MSIYEPIGVLRLAPTAEVTEKAPPRCGSRLVVVALDENGYSLQQQHPRPQHTGLAMRYRVGLAGRVRLPFHRRIQGSAGPMPRRQALRNRTLDREREIDCRRAID